MQNWAWNNKHFIWDKNQPETGRALLEYRQLQSEKEQREKQI